MSTQKYPQTQGVSSGGNTINKNLSKRKVNGYSNHFRNAKKARKRQEAEARQAKHDKLSLEQKLKVAIGAKEIARLTKKIAAQKQAQVKPAPLTPEQKLDKTVKHTQALVATVPQGGKKKK